MNICAGRIVLDFYNNADVALKRRKLSELCESIQKRFHISISEIEDFDDPERCVIGFAAVVPSAWKDSRTQDFIEKICKTIDGSSFARVLSEETEILALSP